MHPHSIKVLLDLPALNVIQFQTEANQVWIKVDTPATVFIESLKAPQVAPLIHTKCRSL